MHPKPINLSFVVVEIGEAAVLRRKMVGSMRYVGHEGYARRKTEGKTGNTLDAL